MFSHQKLIVYKKALTCAATLVQDSRTWDKRHAFVDHLLRASESILMNLVESTRLRGTAHRQHCSEYAIGSAMECSACLDIAMEKQLLLAGSAQARKESLCEVVRMLAGLRRSWANDELQEEEGLYEDKTKLFGFERLDVYQVGLKFIAWFHSQAAGAALSTRLFRMLDKLGTSVVLKHR